MRQLSLHEGVILWQRYTMCDEVICLEEVILYKGYAMREGESPFRIPRHLHSCPLRLRTFASCMVGRKDTSGDLRLWTLAVLPRVS